MDASDPRLAALITETVDRRVRAALDASESIRYGIVSAVAGGRASVKLANGATASPGFAYPPMLVPKVGDLVRVVMRGADRYIDANLSAPATAPAVVSPPSSVFGWTWYKGTVGIVCGADVETEVDATFRVTYPGDPARAGQHAVIRVMADVSHTLTVANTEAGIVIRGSVAAADMTSTRVHWQRGRVNAAATMHAIHCEGTARWPADAAVEFRILVRMAAAGTWTMYGNAVADYVSRIGYEVIGFVPAGMARPEAAEGTTDG